jgi:GntR family transcriptional regulator/MocR family aminotransferase
MHRAFVLPEIRLDSTSGWSLRQQIHSQLAEAIRDGRIANGARLPSSRLLAAILGVSRNTVVDAYEHLLEDRLIAAKPNSGVRVTHARLNTVPNFSNLRRTARAAHYPARTIQIEDPDGTMLYLNAAP